MSVQVYRFQQRITNLQLHHEAASARHSETVDNYNKINSTMMNSLLSNLKSTKNMKKTKRIAKSKPLHSQTSKYNHSVNNIDQKLLEKCDFVPIEEKYFLQKNELTNESCLSCPHPGKGKEPIFPPPTYAEPESNSPFVHYESNNSSWSEWSPEQISHCNKWSLISQSKNCSTYPNDSIICKHDPSQYPRDWVCENRRCDDEFKYQSYSIPCDRPDLYWETQPCFGGYSRPISTNQQNSETLYNEQLNQTSVVSNSAVSNANYSSVPKNVINPILASTYQSVPNHPSQHNLNANLCHNDSCDYASKYSNYLLYNDSYSFSPLSNRSAPYPNIRM